LELTTISGPDIRQRPMIWKLSLRHRPHVGIDPFAGYVAAWLVLFCVLSVIEPAAIARDVFKGGRRLPAIKRLPAATSRRPDLLPVLDVDGGLDAELDYRVIRS